MRATAGIVCVALVCLVGACGQDPTDGISHEAQLLVDRTIDEFDLKPVCSASEWGQLQADFLAAQSGGEPPELVTLRQQIVWAYISRECDPCFVVDTLSIGPVGYLKRDPDQPILGELVRASAPVGLAEDFINVKTVAPRDYLVKSGCLSWHTQSFDLSQGTAPSSDPSKVELQQLITVTVAGESTKPVVLWSIPFDGPEALLAIGTTAYVVDSTSLVTAIDIASGRELWSTAIAEESESSGGVTVAASDNSLFIFAPFEYAAELTLADGTIRRQVLAPGNPPGWLTVEGIEAEAEKRVRVNPFTYDVEGLSSSGQTLWVTTGDHNSDPPPVAFRSTDTVVFIDPSSNLIGLEWPQ